MVRLFFCVANCDFRFAANGAGAANSAPTSMYCPRTETLHTDAPRAHAIYARARQISAITLSFVEAWIAQK